MEEERSNNNLCKICNKSFANGKAMGGHMRSHMVKHPLPLKPKYSLPHPKSPPPPPSSSPMHFYRSQNQRELISAVTDHHRPAAVMINGGEDGSDDSPRSSSLITRRRSKRRRRSTVESVSNIVAVQSPEREGSSDSEICLVDEEVAWTLVSLARGTWSTGMEDLLFHEDELEEEDEDEDELLVVIQKRQPRTPTSKIGSYRCETCKKCFRSYQALGGHRASHKKMKGIVIKDDVPESESESEQGSGSESGGGATAAAAIGGYKCPFCDKVFESGQALGGHKKVHFAYLPVAAAPTPVRNSAKSGGESLDLNRPADELSDGEVSLATAIEAEESYW